MEPDANGVLAELVHGDGGVETVHPGAVIGAGGAHSVTRDSMGELLEGAPPTKAISSSPTSRCRHWSNRVEIFPDPGVDPVRAGVRTGGMVLIRPDGHIGFRFLSTDA